MVNPIQDSVPLVLEEQRQQYLTFLLKDEYYGIHIKRVREIIEYTKVTAVPLMPEFVKGVLNLRGDVVPIIDLSQRFGKGTTEILRRSCIVVLEIVFEQQLLLIGIVVDAVAEVLDIDLLDIEPPPSFGAKIRTQFIKGVTTLDEHLVILLDGEKVLSIEEMTALIEKVIEH